MTPHRPGRLAQTAYRRMPSPWTAGIDLAGRAARPLRPRHLDVMTSLGGGDADVLQVMLLSLSESHPRDRIRFWLFHLHLSDAQIAVIAGFCAGLPNLELCPVEVPAKAEFARLAKLGGRPFGARFLWYVAHRHLPRDMDRVLYLDPLDTIVAGDLVPFLHQPLAGRLVAACRELPFRPALHARPAAREQARGADADRLARIAHGMMNSGAMVLNLARMRREGLDVGTYLGVAEWARAELGLGFGDQGLFALTHGSDYVRAHDRYNFRFHDAGPRGLRAAPTVIHFAGRIAKPFHLRLSPAQEAHVRDRLAATGARAFRLNPTQTLAAHDLAHYRRWWQICARTPVHDRIAGPAADHAARVIDGRTGD